MQSELLAGQAGIDVGQRLATVYDETDLKGRRGELCGSGLLDPELDEDICEIDTESSNEMLLSEAWNRGCGLAAACHLHHLLLLP